MKKEYIFILVCLLVITSSFIFKSFFITERYIEIKNLSKEFMEVKSKYLRDSAFYAHSDIVKRAYDKNKKNEVETKSVMITGFVAKIEKFLAEAGIKYQSSDITYHSNTVVEKGLEYLEASLSMEADLVKLTKLISLIEKDEALIDIISFQIQNNAVSLDEYRYAGVQKNKNKKSNLLRVSIVLQLVKVL